MGRQQFEDSGRTFQAVQTTNVMERWAREHLVEILVGYPVGRYIENCNSRENLAEVRIWGPGALMAVKAMGLDNSKGAGRTTEGRRELTIQPSNILCVDGLGEASEVIWQRCQGQEEKA